MQPTNLGQYLQEASFIYRDQWTEMALGLENLEDKQLILPDKLKIEDKFSPLKGLESQ